MKTKLILLTLLLALTVTSAAQAAIPHVINFQGKATDKANAPLNGTYKLTFRIYDALTGGNKEWEEVHATVPITNGIFQVPLNVDLPFNEDYWVSLEVNTDGEMSPRTRLASTAYAYTADHANTANTANTAETANRAIYADNLSVNPVPPGIIMIWPADTPPAGWLLCDGRAVSRTEYASLFETIGTSYGFGNSSTTFNLPDLRGRFPLGQDDMGGSSADRATNAQADLLNGSAGEENHTLTIAEMPAHTHSANFRYNGRYASTGSVMGHGGATGSAGGGQAHNNMPPYITLNYIIKHE